MVTAAPFTVARTSGQPSAPSADSWVTTMWYIYTMESCSVASKNEIKKFSKRWMNLESNIK